MHRTEVLRMTVIGFEPLTLRLQIQRVTIEPPTAAIRATTYLCYLSLTLFLINVYCSGP